MTKSISLHRIRQTSDCYLPMLEELYVSAFPSEERRELPTLRDKICNEGRFHAHAILCEEEFVGLLTWWDFDTFVYGEHFAMRPDLRGRGLGTRAFDFLRHYAPNRPILIEVELPTDDLTRRRIDFYTRAGLSIVDIPYLQPPYRPSDLPLPMALMLHGALGDLTPSQMIRTIHLEVYGSSILES